MIVSHRHRFIFLKTWKTGGTSIELALRSLCGPDDIVTQVTEDGAGEPSHGPQNYLFPRSEWPLAKRLRWHLGWRPTAGRSDMDGAGYFGHASAGEVRDRLGETTWSRYFKFTVERNPWDREVSRYYFRVKYRANPLTFPDFVRTDPPLDNWSIYTIDNHVAVDHVIRFGDLKAGLAKALAHIGLDAPDPARAKSGFRPQRSDYRAMYDDDTRAAVAQRYTREIDHFGWSF